MDTPKIIDIQQFYISKNLDKYRLIIYAYTVFKKDFIENEDNPLFFHKIKVVIKSKLLDCSNCDYNCNNDFECNDCPWKDKEDIFQHLTSDEDYSLVLKNPNDYRTPGVFSKDRTIRIGLIRTIIEGVSGSETKWKIEPYKKSLDTIKVYHREMDILIIMRLKTFSSGHQIIYLITAYNNPPRSYLKGLK